MSTLAKELTATTRVIQSSSYELSTLVSGKDTCLATLMSCDRTKQSVCGYTPRGVSTLVKELTAATRVMQSSSYELSALVSGKAKCKQVKATT